MAADLFAIESLSAEELKKELLARGLPSKGTLPELAARVAQIRTADAELVRTLESLRSPERWVRSTQLAKTRRLLREFVCEDRLYDLTGQCRLPARIRLLAAAVGELMGERSPSVKPARGTTFAGHHILDLVAADPTSLPVGAAANAAALLDSYVPPAELSRLSPAHGLPRRFALLTSFDPHEDAGAYAFALWVCSVMSVAEHRGGAPEDSLLSRRAGEAVRSAVGDRQRGALAGDESLALAVFRDWDSGGSGTIGRGAFARVLQSLDERLDDNAAQRLFTASDTDRDGLVDYALFLRWIDE